MSNRDETQQKAFLRWANIVLAKHPDQPQPIENLVDSLQDGLTLGHIAEAVIPTKLKLGKPKNDLARIQNITMSLGSFESNGCKLINIHSTAVGRGDKKTILGLMFQLCIHYQVQSSSDNGQSVSVLQLKQKLIEWINEMLKTVRVEDNLTIRVLGSEIYNEEPLICHDLDRSLVDGTIILGLIASLVGPQLATVILAKMSAEVDRLIEGKDDEIFSKLEKFSALSKVQKRHIIVTYVAMATALEELEIPVLVDAEDMVLNGDSSANLAYLSYYHNIDVDHEKLQKKQHKVVKNEDFQILKQYDGVAPPIPPNVVTLESFNPDKDYDEDVILYL